MKLGRKKQGRGRSSGWACRHLKTIDLALNRQAWNKTASKDALGLKATRTVGTETHLAQSALDALQPLRIVAQLHRNAHVLILIGGDQIGETDLREDGGAHVLRVATCGCPEYVPTKDHAALSSLPRTGTLQRYVTSLRRVVLA